MISGGSIDGDSNRAHKSRKRRDCMEVEGVRRNEAVISFGPEDLKGVNLPHNDALVIQARVANYDIMRIFVDSGSSVNVIFKEVLIQMDLQRYHLEAVDTTLFGFAGHAIYPEGEIILPLTLGTRELKKTVMTTFTVVDAPSSYNIILGWPAMNELRAVASTYHQKIFPVGSQVGEVRGDQPSSWKCYVEAIRVDQKRARKEGKKVQSCGEMEKGEVQFVADEEQEVVEIGQGKEIRVAQDLDLSTRQEWIGISPLIAEHQLNILSGSQSVKQKKKHFGPEKDKVIDEHVRDLLKAECRGHLLASYEQSVREVVGQECRVYVDDIFGKSKEVSDFIFDLDETFATLMEYGIKLKPAKCIFGVKSGKFLGFVVTDRGIEVNQEKVKSVLNMPSPLSLLQLQKLAGRIASLSRFLSQSAHRSYLFFKVLPKAHQFGWDEKCEQAFRDLKSHLAELLVLVKPEPGEKLFVYLSTTEYAVSSVLINKEGSDQKPFYYVSHALRSPELRCSEVEKIV
ncbi:uncharacterized protein [Primulina huaijiensis]|uniref:uncharacterized protein n=1 Tax=Primulina huaijiensis TaxID=1492673 RepID=UPI003CC735D3